MLKRNLLLVSILLSSIANANVISACGHVAAGIKRNDCISQQLNVANRQLQTTYGNLENKLSASNKLRLFASQRDWTLYRDSECEYVGNFHRQTKTWSLHLAQCHYDLTRMRVAQLEEHLAQHEQREHKLGKRGRRFKQVQQALLSKVKIPILLPEPSLIHANYPNVAVASADKYQVNFDNTASCHGAVQCSFGTLFAEKIPDVQDSLVLTNRGTPVSLLGRNNGRFTASTHKVGTHFNTLTWDMNGVRYQLSLKRPAKAEFIAIANSAILRGPLQ